jgi:meso-butanediol dehydrogenase / (S,S)-butanediol dehydrogenase / diacetyl reductase
MGEFVGEVAVFTGAGSGIGRGAALDYAQDHIRVNGVVAGATDTPLLRNKLKTCPGPDAEERRIISTIPVLRFATPEAIAKAVRILASSVAGYITGTSLAVDGGLLAQA